MIEVVLISVGLVLAVTGVALALPCEACRLRRERMKQAYTAWQARQTSQK